MPRREDSALPAKYVLKICLGGASGTGKTCFLKGSLIPQEFSSSSIGVSIDKIECMINNKDSLKLMVWDLKGNHNYRILHESFSMGTSGALVFFDISNRKSFKEIDYWIKLFKIKPKSIPIYLIAAKCDLNNQVSEHDIIQKVRKYQLDGYFSISVKNQDNRKPILQKIIRNLHVVPPKCKLSIITPQQDIEFQKFINLFSICPICKKENHYDYLKNFYFNEEPENVQMRNTLLEIVKKSKKMAYNRNLTIGIPCCKCFNKIFKE